MSQLKNLKRKTVHLLDESKYRFNGHRWVNYETKETLNDAQLAEQLTAEGRNPNEEMYHNGAVKEAKIKNDARKKPKQKKKISQPDNVRNTLFDVSHASRVIDAQRYLSELSSLVSCKVEDLKSLEVDNECAMITCSGEAIPIEADAVWRYVGSLIEEQLKDSISEIEARNNDGSLNKPLSYLKKLAHSYGGLLHVLVSVIDSSTFSSKTKELN